MNRIERKELRKKLSMTETADLNDAIKQVRHFEWPAQLGVKPSDWDKYPFRPERVNILGLSIKKGREKADVVLPVLHEIEHVLDTRDEERKLGFPIPKWSMTWLRLNHPGWYEAIQWSQLIIFLMILVLQILMRIG